MLDEVEKIHSLGVMISIRTEQIWRENDNIYGIRYNYSEMSSKFNANFLEKYIRSEI